MKYTPLRRLEALLEELFGDTKSIGIRLYFENPPPNFPHLEGTMTRESRILQLRAVGGTDGERANIQEGVRAVYTAIGLIAPEFDSRNWHEVAKSSSPLCLIADTSAVCNGCVHWIAQALWHRNIEIATMSVVERELFGWADQKDLHKDVSLRSKYRVARQLSETPLPNVVDRRPAVDEKAALMLAKVKVKDIKSPDADILLIEQARDLIRSQSPNVQSLFLTGDRQHARSATNVLSAKQVLYCPPPPFNIDTEVIGSASFWQPAEGEGALNLVPLSRVIWTLLCCCGEIVLALPRGDVQIRHYRQGLGVPSDFTDPYLEVSDVSTPSAPSARAPTEAKDLCPPSLRPALIYFVDSVNQLLEGNRIEPSFETDRNSSDTAKFLECIGAMDDTGLPLLNGPFLSAVRANDWDKVGDLFERSPSFAAALEKLNRGGKITSSDRPNVALVRKLGWATRMERNGEILLANGKITSEQFLEYIENLVGGSRDSIPFEFICRHILRDLKVSPMRFENLFRQLNSAGLNPFQWETGGIASGSHSEAVFHFDGTKIVDRLVSAAAFTFGGPRTYRSMRRTG